MRCQRDPFVLDVAKLEARYGPLPSRAAIEQAVRVLGAARR
ncbi:MAG: hypothetical protein ACFB3T_08560 [Geminicoccaceae bacterium]